uniref:Uncharacterized protein n=1 Tax=Trichobilharzia regenti TaxID=157069 RepID=A0AA85JKE2_TRIRE|nr:unnamed protein product [Trichobilharzia regenti]
MGSLWLRNIFGYRLSESELQNVPYPKTELLLHVGLRTTQVSCLFGAVVCAPVATILSTPRTFRRFTLRFAKYATYAVLPGVALGPVLMYIRLHDQPDEAIYDRCYRLRCNKHQLRVDRFAYIGLIWGGIAGFASRVRPLETSVVGMVLGSITAACYNHVEHKLSIQE